jgi:L-lactate dehydrogenase complex protein LldG
MADKREMLERISAALGRTRTGQRPEPLAPFSAASVEKSREEIVAGFCAELEKVGARAALLDSFDNINSYIESLLIERSMAKVAVSDSPVLEGVRRWLAEKKIDALPSLKEFATGPLWAEGQEVDIENSGLYQSYKRSLIGASLGVTSADYAIAATGTLVLVSGGEQHRLISLVPPVHVCVLDSARILVDLTDLFSRASTDHYSRPVPPLAMTFITGPSRTADIELSLTLGVHGPRELHVLIY